MLPKKTDKLIAELRPRKREWLETITSLREMVLSNVALIAETPAPTFAEKDRARLIFDRFLAAGLPDPSIDDMDNVIGAVPGTGQGGRILVFTHMDHQFPASVDQVITITRDRVTGRGVAEDSLALAALITLPDVIKQLGLAFDREIILLATTRSHGRGDFGGIRHFISRHKGTIDFALNLEGVPLGKINYFSLSRVRCDISCTIDAPQDSPWGKITHTSANMIVNEIMNRLFSIPLPRHPKTVINVGMIEGGERYSTVSTHASLKIEMLSEDDATMNDIIEEAHDRCIDVGAKYGVEVRSEFFGRHSAAGISYSHPLVKSAASIVDFLDCRPVIEYANSELAVPLASSIPSVNLGITTGKIGAADSYVDLGSIPNGLLQVISLLYAIDRGFCDA